MSKKIITSKKSGEGQYTDQQRSRREYADTIAEPIERPQLAIRSLLETLPVGVDDKLATVKAAHHVDKDRFQIAFRSLLRDAKP